MAYRRLSIEDVRDEVAALEAHYGIWTADRVQIAGDRDPCTVDELLWWDFLALVLDRATAMSV